MNMKMTVVALVMVLLPALGQASPYILEIHDQFIITAAVADKCIKPDRETQTAFLANAAMVYVYAFQELKNQYPERSEAEIIVAMNGRQAQLTKKVREVVDARGCSDADIQQVIRRYFFQAKWKPLK